MIFFRGCILTFAITFVFIAPELSGAAAGNQKMLSARDNPASVAAGKSDSRIEGKALCDECLRGGALPKQAFEGISDLNKKFFRRTAFFDGFLPEEASNSSEFFGSVGFILGPLDPASDQSSPSGNSNQTAQEKVGNRSLGSGFMFAPCLSMTARHVISSSIKVGSTDNPEDQVTFYQPKKGENTTSGGFSKRIGTMVVDGKYYDDGEKLKSKDWAVLKHQYSPGLDDKIIPICPKKLTTGTSDNENKDAINIKDKRNIFSTASLNYEFNPKNLEENKLQEQKNCKIFGQGDIIKGAWPTNCPAIRGVSGSPVLVTDPTTHAKCAVGMIIGMSTEVRNSPKLNNSTYNYMISFSDIFSEDELKNLIETHGCQKKPKLIHL